jgi:hypothetical protein
MIARVAVDVVQDEGQARASPLGETALGTFRLEQTARDEATLQVPHRHIRAVGNENGVERKTACPTMALAPEMSLPEEVARVQAQTSDG